MFKYFLTNIHAHYTTTEKEITMSSDAKRRDFLGMTLGGVAAAGAVASLCAMKRSWDPLPSVVSAGFTSVDLSQLQEGVLSTVEWLSLIHI